MKKGFCKKNTYKHRHFNLLTLVLDTFCGTQVENFVSASPKTTTNNTVTGKGDSCRVQGTIQI